VKFRLTVDSAKYGAIDRTPFVVGASATYSRNLFLPVDAIVEQNLSFMMFLSMASTSPLQSPDSKLLNSLVRVPVFRPLIVLHTPNVKGAVVPGPSSFIRAIFGAST
jgi:hypothetical protein